MQFFASKNVGQFAPDKVGQFDWIVQLECMPSLLIERRILKSRMNREVHVRFCEEHGVKFPLLTRLYAALVHLQLCDAQFLF